MTLKRYIAVVFVDDETIRTHLDGMRLILDPSEKMTSHITVRGPYEDRRRNREFDLSVEERNVSVLGVGKFVSENQQTVHLHCGFPGYRTVWHKPDYSSASPHITLYDGPSRRLATDLYNEIKQRSFSFKFLGSPIQYVPIEKGQTSFRFFSEFDFQILAKLTGVKIDPTSIKNLVDRERLHLVISIWNSLGHHIFRHSSKH